MRNRAKIVFIFTLFFPLTAFSGTESELLEEFKSFVLYPSDAIYSDPRLTLSIVAHYASLDGRAYAREIGREKLYSSEDMDALDIPENMGIFNMIVYEGNLDWRVSTRNHLVVTYIHGQTQGAGRIDYTTGFDDQTFRGPTETQSEILLESWQVGWYIRAMDKEGKYGRLKFDLGAGALDLHSNYSLATEEFGERYQEEQVIAPLLPYMLARSEWNSKRNLILGAEFISGSSKYGLIHTGLVKEESDGFYYEADVYGLYPLTEHISLISGVNLWNLEIDFDGVENDEYKNKASNEIEMNMAGAYIGITLNDFHVVLGQAVNNLLRQH
jgi:hypothetical protein